MLWAWNSPKNRTKIDNRRDGIDIWRVSPPEQDQPTDAVKAIPRVALIVMVIIVVALAMVSLFANFQRLRQDKIESVTITPAASPTPSAP